MLTVLTDEPVAGGGWLADQSRVSTLSPALVTSVPRPHRVTGWLDSVRFYNFYDFGDRNIFV